MGDNIFVLTAAEILLLGLKQVNFTDERVNRVQGNPSTSKTNIDRFKGHFGCNHVVVAALWEDLQVTDLPQAKWKVKDADNIMHLFEALHFLKSYKTELNRESTFDFSPKTLRKHCWAVLAKIQALKSEQIVFPEDFGDDVWIMTVDGINFEINEPSNLPVSKDPHMFDHKHNHAGLTYELGVQLFDSKLIWMKGPFKAGETNDAGRFSVEGGLREKLTTINKKALGDKIYGSVANANQISSYNAWDRDDVMQFKARAQMRHEQFNGMLTDFGCLANRFRHPSDNAFEKFAICFEAVAVICCYRMDYGEPLYNVLAGIELEADTSN